LKIELSKDDLEKAVKNYIDLWFPSLDVESIEFIRTKQVKDLTVKITTKEKGE